MGERSKPVHERQFLGRGWGFPPRFDRHGKEAEMVAELQDIEQSLHILFGTAPGERVMQPTYGCGLRRMVFEQMDESMRTELKELVRQAVLFFEVRITLHSVEIDASQSLDGILRLLLDYTVRSTNTRSNMVYPLYLLEGSGFGAAP